MRTSNHSASQALLREAFLKVLNVFLFKHRVLGEISKY